MSRQDALLPLLAVVHAVVTLLALKKLRRPPTYTSVTPFGGAGGGAGGGGGGDGDGDGDGGTGGTGGRPFAKTAVQLARHGVLVHSKKPSELML